MAECARAYPEEVTGACVRKPTMEDIVKVTEVDSLSRGLFSLPAKLMVQYCPDQVREQDPEKVFSGLYCQC